MDIKKLNSTHLEMDALELRSSSQKSGSLYVHSDLKKAEAVPAFIHSVSSVTSNYLFKFGLLTSLETVTLNGALSSLNGHSKHDVNGQDNRRDNRYWTPRRKTKIGTHTQKSWEISFPVESDRAVKRIESYLVRQVFLPW